MSNEDIELLKARWEGWNKILQTLFGGVKDLCVVFASIATLYIQTENRGTIEQTARTTASTNAITSKWWAGRTGDPKDEAKAEAAQAVSERMP